MKDGEFVIAAVGDIHCSKTSGGAMQALFGQLEPSADVLLLCGDLTDYGLAEEARVLAKELASVRVPIVAVLGNHDFESGHQAEVAELLQAGGVHVLDGDACEIGGVGFAGAKGFLGGFGRHTLEPWGEQATKRFVQEATDEAVKLGAALSKLRTPQRVAVLHYSPVAATVMGEPPEIHPFLGTSRLEEPLNRYEVTAVFHGHAHHGTAEGRTAGGAPVFNVALPLLRDLQPGQPPFRLVQLPAVREASGDARSETAEPGAPRA